MFKNKFTYVYLLITLIIGLSFSQEKKDTLSIKGGGKITLEKISVTDSITIKTDSTWSDSVILFFTITEKDSGKFTYQWNTIKRRNYINIMKHIPVLETNKNYIITVVESRGNGSYGKEYLTLAFDTK